MQTKARYYRITFNKDTFAFGEPIKASIDWEAANTTAEVSCVKFKINIKCAWLEEKTVYRVRFDRKNFKIEGQERKLINLQFMV